jgi:small subunit ribosomal protein S8
MVSTDPISDMFSRIRNAIAVNHSQVSLPYSRVKEMIARTLVDKGFLKAVELSGEGITKRLEITINADGSNATITEINRISRPGQRIYVGSDKIPSVKRGRGIVVLSTSQGLMAGDEAKAKHLGGELICKVY